MKVLPTARILIIDSQSERREILRDALTAFGVGGIHEAADLAAAPSPVQADILVVYADDPENVPENPYRDGAGAPAILVVDAPVPVLVRAAARGGYDAALGAPLAPRLLYRRIGSVLQRARRVVRIGALTAPVAVEQLPVEAVREEVLSPSH
ncbi:ANTAR domain-containing protein [Xanthobacter agilis]|uniref:AmiR/NasT family two-component response regulator n=1 Tax=Xanthobacter agilis TaxID=47492 RepID=A0ABU0LJG2_XANAG|nr:hypothetical protein [Xanthobacter agilis]MDQ0507281.1 AmiR/NasT family two-component response regulator [Xanthobacter agilis]